MGRLLVPLKRSKVRSTTWLQSWKKEAEEGAQKQAYCDDEMHSGVVHHQTGSHESRSHGNGCKGNGQLRQEEQAKDTKSIADSQEAQTSVPRP